jgi:hypothetical protein
MPGGLCGSHRCCCDGGGVRGRPSSELDGYICVTGHGTKDDAPRDTHCEDRLDRDGDILCRAFCRSWIFGLNLSDPDTLLRRPPAADRTPGNGTRPLPIWLNLPLAELAAHNILR